MERGTECATRVTSSVQRVLSSASFGAACIALTLTARAQVCPLERVSRLQNGTQIPSLSYDPSVSADGRIVTFVTPAALAPTDTNGVEDLYAVDLATGAVEPISVDSAWQFSNGQSAFSAGLSADGRFVVFESEGTNLVPGLVGSSWRAFVRDRATATTFLAGLTNSGADVAVVPWPRISADGRFVIFATVGEWQVYVRDLQAATTQRVSVSTGGVVANGLSGALGTLLALSADGRYAFFSSSATNLVAGDTNGVYDIFRRDRVAGVTERASVSTSGQQSDQNALELSCSADGRFVAWNSAASTLVAGDTNGVHDIFVRDMLLGTTERVSVDSGGTQSNAACYEPALSPDGRFVAFSSAASNLVAGDTNGYSDAFVHDRLTHRTERVSLTSSGAQSGGGWSAVMSANAEVVVFQSGSPLVPGDTNGATDVYARRCPVPTSYCTAKVNSLGCVPTLASSGVAQSSWSSGFVLSAQPVLNRQAGLLIYSTAGPAALPFRGGFLCVQAPLRRTPVLFSGGSPSGTDCSGALALDFNAWIASGSDLALVAGASVWSQFWSRDPGFAPPQQFSLSDAQWFVIRP